MDRLALFRQGEKEREKTVIPGMEGKKKGGEGIPGGFRWIAIWRRKKGGESFEAHS